MRFLCVKELYNLITMILLTSNKFLLCFEITSLKPKEGSIAIISAVKIDWPSIVKLNYKKSNSPHKFRADI